MTRTKFDGNSLRALLTEYAPMGLLVLLINPLEVCQAQPLTAAVPLYREVIPSNLEATRPEFGSAVCVIDDVNQDGVVDLLVGAPGANGETGAARLVSGADGSTLLDFCGDNSLDRFGHAVARIADLTNDGIGDLVIAARGGYVRVYNSATGTLISTIQAPLISNHFSTGFGSAVTTLDVDRDGIDEVLVADVGDEVFPGGVLAFTANPAVHLRTVPFARARSLSSVGDLDNDGIREFIVGGTNRASVVSGSSLSNGPGAYIYDFFSSVSTDLFGWSVSGLSDLDGDGVNDIIVGAPQGSDFAGNTGGPGYVDVYSGRDGTLLYSLPGDKPGDRFGWSVAGAGDTDGDGNPDFLVGAPGADIVKIAEPAYTVEDSNSGLVRVFKHDGNPIATYIGYFGERFGFAVAAADLNNDSLQDGIAGAPFNGIFLASDGTPASTRVGRLQFFSVPDRLIRLSAKRILDRDGSSPWDQVRYDGMIVFANLVLSVSNTHIRLVDPSSSNYAEFADVVDIVDPMLPHDYVPDLVNPLLATVLGNSWFDVNPMLSTTLIEEMEEKAQAAPSRLLWLPNALNAYLSNSLFQGLLLGFSSFPLNRGNNGSGISNDIVFLAPVPQGLATPTFEGVILCHELGHFLDLYHTHSNTEPTPGLCAQPPPGLLGIGTPNFPWDTGDCMWDTVDEINPVPLTPQGFIDVPQHDTNFTMQASSQVLSQEFTRNVLCNVMSEHSRTPIGSQSTIEGEVCPPLFTPHQTLRMLKILHNFRNHVMRDIVGTPSLTTGVGSPVQLSYAGNQLQQEDISLSGSGLPTDLGFILPTRDPQRGLSLGNGDRSDQFSTWISIVSTDGNGNPTGQSTTYSLLRAIHPGVHDLAIFESFPGRSPRSTVQSAKAVIVTPALDVFISASTPITITIEVYSKAQSAPMFLAFEAPRLVPEGHPGFEYSSSVLGFDGANPPMVGQSFTTVAGRASLTIPLTPYFDPGPVTFQAFEVGAPNVYTNPVTVVIP